MRVKIALAGHEVCFLAPEAVLEYARWTCICLICFTASVVWMSLSFTARLIVLLLGLCGVALHLTLSVAFRLHGITPLLPVSVQRLLFETSLLEFLQGGVWSQYFAEIFTLCFISLTKGEMAETMRRFPSPVRHSLHQKGLVRFLPKNWQLMLRPPQEQAQAHPTHTTHGIELIPTEKKDKDNLFLWILIYRIKQRLGIPTSGIRSRGLKAMYAVLLLCLFWSLYQRRRLPIIKKLICL